MNFRSLAVLLVSLLPLVSLRASDGASVRPGLYKRTLQMMHLAPRGPREQKNVRAKNLTLNMELAPLPLKLPGTRQLKVTLSLANHSRRSVQLDFPTTQRFELLIRDQAGKTITQWSEDQSFANEPGYVTVNPGERIEYNALLATRDLVAGRSYTVEGFFPNFTALRIQKTILPEK